MKTVCLGLLLIAQAAAAQSLPDAKGLLEREATALDDYQTYSYIEETTMPGGVAGVSIDMRQTVTVSAMNPGKRRMVTRMGSEEITVLVADGRDTWIYMRPLAVYARIPDGSDLADTFNGAVKLPVAASVSSRVLRAETLQIDGEAHDCWVVESRGDSFSIAGMELRDLATTVWIDKTLGLAWRRTMSGHMQLAGLGAIDVNTVSNRRALVLNEAVPESVFVFTPPPGARRDDALLTQALAGVGAALAAPAPAPARAPAAAPSSAEEPQAFVPTLIPIDQVEPEWPAAAKAQGVSGIVEVLVTIDAQGTVAQVESLSGPVPLRGAAEAAVRQWRFHPVVRRGRDVAAYTSQVVPFFDSSKPIAPELNIGEELAAAQRVDALARQWPQSKQDKLADLENDLEGRQEVRQFFLPQLARAAWDAGAVEKAELYASDALASARPDGARDGDAVSEGHQILGMAALKSGNVPLAAQHLLDSGHTTGSPVLSSFGPNFTLAQQLLDAGERDVVVEYLTLCEQFWVTGRAQLREWAAAIRAGSTPRLNRTMMWPAGAAGSELDAGTPRIR